MIEPRQDVKDGFVQIHCHSEFSVRDALSKLQDLIDFAKENKLKHLAITDHGVISSWARLWKYARKEEITPVFGCEVYVNNHRFVSEEQRANDETVKAKFKKYFHLLVLAYNDKGIKNLIKINNDAHMNGFYSKPRTDFEMLKKHNEGLVITSACLGGEVCFHLMNGDYNEAKKVAQQYKDIFGKRYFIELQVHQMQEQIDCNQELVKIAQELDIETVVTNDSHYIRYADQDVHDMLITIRDRSSKDDFTDCENLKGYHARELYYKNYDEMYASWERYHKNEYFTEEVFIKSANNCHKILDLVQETSFDAEVKLPKLYNDEGQIFQQKIKEGLRYRFKDNVTQEIKDRIRYEYSILRKMNYIGYFLILEDIITYCNKEHIYIGPGRGSVAGSLIAYVLGLTEVNPLDYGLIFERFLDLGRDKAIFPKMI